MTQSITKNGRADYYVSSLVKSVYFPENSIRIYEQIFFDLVYLNSADNAGNNIVNRYTRNGTVNLLVYFAYQRQFYENVVRLITLYHW